MSDQCKLYVLVKACVLKALGALHEIKLYKKQQSG